jgi:hypothetical protein
MWQCPNGAMSKTSGTGSNIGATRLTWGVRRICDCSLSVAGTAVMTRTSFLFLLG